MRLRGTRPGLLLLAACTLAAPACAPKGGGSGDGSGGAATPTPAARVAWADEAKQLLEYGLAGARVFWNEPAIRPGERVRWLITARSFPDRFLDVARDASADRWTLVAGHPSAPRRTLVASLVEGRIESLAISGTDVRSSETRRERDLEAIVPPAIVGTAGEASFAAIGGRILGNEVLRVPAGEFRARHATVPGEGGVTWHLYLVRTVPGGIAKVEMFKRGATDPSLVMELDDSTRLPKPR